MIAISRLAFVLRWWEHGGNLENVNNVLHVFDIHPSISLGEIAIFKSHSGITKRLYHMFGCSFRWCGKWNHCRYWRFPPKTFKSHFRWPKMKIFESIFVFASKTSKNCHLYRFFIFYYKVKPVIFNWWGFKFLICYLLSLSHVMSMSSTFNNKNISSLLDSSGINWTV